MEFVLSTRAAKLLKLCEAEGVATFDDLLALAVADSVCPAICMAEGCDFIATMETDQEQGHCEACGRNMMVSVLILADLV